MNQARLYPIAPDYDKFDEFSRYYPGIAPDGTQWLVIQSSPLVCAHQFDAEGQYLGREFRTTDWADAFSWAKELKLTPATIRVQKFATEIGAGPRLVIKDQPYHFELDDLATMGTVEERDETLRWWRDLEAFVLFWDGTEYTIDSRGVRFQ